MAVSYKRLWKLLVDKEMSKSDLRKKAEIAPNTMTKLRREQQYLGIMQKLKRLQVPCMIKRRRPGYYNKNSS